MVYIYIHIHQAPLVELHLHFGPQSDRWRFASPNSDFTRASALSNFRPAASFPAPLLPDHGKFWECPWLWLEILQFAIFFLVLLAWNWYLRRGVWLHMRVIEGREWGVGNWKGKRSIFPNWKATITYWKIPRPRRSLPPLPFFCL